MPQFPQGELGGGVCLGMLIWAPCFSQPPLSFPARRDGAVGPGWPHLQGPAGQAAACARGRGGYVWATLGEGMWRG